MLAKTHFNPKQKSPKQNIQAGIKRTEAPCLNPEEDNCGVKKRQKTYNESLKMWNNLQGIGNGRKWEQMQNDMKMGKPISGNDGDSSVKALSHKVPPVQQDQFQEKVCKDELQKSQSVYWHMERGLKMNKKGRIIENRGEQYVKVNDINKFLNEVEKRQFFHSANASVFSISSQKTYPQHLLNGGSSNQQVYINHSCQLPETANHTRQDLAKYNQKIRANINIFHINPQAPRGTSLFQTLTDRVMGIQQFKDIERAFIDNVRKDHIKPPKPKMIEIPRPCLEHKICQVCDQNINGDYLDHMKQAMHRNSLNRQINRELYRAIDDTIKHLEREVLAKQKKSLEQELLKFASLQNTGSTEEQSPEPPCSPDLGNIENPQEFPALNPTLVVVSEPKLVEAEFEQKPKQVETEQEPQRNEAQVNISDEERIKLHQELFKMADNEWDE